ncbi:hypothetical protein BDZ94DRAFT_296827 [Collybia nuda]|uniref:Uncharacterized protein n=1 Tax=Collybia nuda TaxID=64659 RepID=A0A9P5YB95_9AGAR|nr:hypothetical protein BDZ94DRAFT_296827 [Collybia nuda]
MSFSDLRANVVALFTTSVLYGINAVTFFVCIKVLLGSRGRASSWRLIHYTMITTALVMFAVATLDIGVIFDRCIKIFIDEMPQRMTTFSGISNWWSIVEFSNTVVQTFIGDAILICRCLVIWNRRWKIVLGPAATCCIGTGCGIAAAAVGSTNFHPNNQEEIQPFIIPFLALTLVTNVATSSLIIFRIWNVGRRSTPYLVPQEAGGALPRAIRVTLEAGLLYTTAVLVLLITYSTGHHSQIIIGRALIQIIGIVFNSIISSRARQKGSLTVAPTTMLPLDAMVINQEVVVSHDPPDKQGRRIAERAKKNRVVLW